MAKQNDFDPVAAWQNMISLWERQLNDLSTKFSTNETFAGSMSKATKLSLATRKGVEDNLDRLVRSMQFATQVQMGEALDRLDRIEQKIDRLVEAAAGEEKARPSSANRPRRTRKPAEPAA